MCSLTRRVALLVVLAMVPPAAAGCAGLASLLGQAAPVDATPVSEQVAQQRALDKVREDWQIVLDVVKPLVRAKAIRDVPTQATIRTVIKQVEGDPEKGTKGDIADAQALLDAGQTVPAAFVVDRIAAAVATVDRIGKQAKGSK